MGDRKPPRPTYQDVIDAPERMIGEILNGELVLSPRPAGPHMGVTTALSAWLHTRFGRNGKPGGWIIGFEPELHLGENVVIPDLAGWRLERMEQIDDVPYFTTPPDWVCEVLSRWTEKYDRVDKLPIYAEHGVGHVWFINPMRRMLEVMRRLDKLWLRVGVHCDDEVVRAEPFEALELDLATLWVDLKPKPKPTGGRASEPWAEFEPDL